MQSNIVRDCGLDYRSGLIIQIVESNDVIGKRLNQNLSFNDLMF